MTHQRFNDRGGVQPFRVRLSRRKGQHSRRRQTQDPVRDRSRPRPEHVLLTSKAHDDEADTSRDSDLSDLLSRRSDGDHRLNARWRTGLGGELLDLLIGPFNLDTVVRLEMWAKALDPFERRDYVNEQQRDTKRVSERRSGAHLRDAPFFEVDRYQNAANVDPRWIHVRWRLLRRRREQHGYSCLSQHFLSCRSQEQPAIAAQAVRGHDEQLCVFAPRERDELGGGFANEDHGFRRRYGGSSC